MFLVKSSFYGTFFVKSGNMGIKNWFLNICGKVFDIAVEIFAVVILPKFLLGQKFVEISYIVTFLLNF